MNPAVFELFPVKKEKWARAMRNGGTEELENRGNYIEEWKVGNENWKMETGQSENVEIAKVKNGVGCY